MLYMLLPLVQGEKKTGTRVRMSSMGAACQIIYMRVPQEVPVTIPLVQVFTRCGGKLYILEQLTEFLWTSVSSSGG